MINLVHPAILLVAFGVVVLTHDTYAEPTDYQLLADHLLGEDLGERAIAIDRTKDILDNLHEALVEAMEGEARYLEDRHIARMRGDKLENHRDPWFLARLTEAVIKLRDPRTIPSLVVVLGTGSPATPFALAAFGQQAVPALIEVVKTSDDIFQVDQAMVALRCLVEYTDVHPLSADAVEAITNVAEIRLDNPIRLAYSGVILGKAVDLVIALEDPRLMKTIELIASRTRRQFVLEASPTLNGLIEYRNTLKIA